MFGKHEIGKFRAWMDYLKGGGLDRPAASIPFDLISTDGATDDTILFLASMLTMAAFSGPPAAEEAMEGFMRDPENFASEIDGEIKEKMASAQDAMDSMRSTEETLLSVTTLLHLFGLWQEGQTKLLHPAYTLRKLILDPDEGEWLASSRWMNADEDNNPTMLTLSATEELVTSELMKFGVGLLLPLSDNLPFDLVLHWEGRMFRAKLRQAKRKDTSTRFSLPTDSDCDIIVLCDGESVYLLKPKEFKGRHGFTIRHRPTKNGRSKGCNFHEDFVVSAKRVKSVLTSGHRR